MSPKHTVENTQTYPHGNRRPSCGRAHLSSSLLWGWSLGCRRQAGFWIWNQRGPSPFSPPASPRHSHSMSKRWKIKVWQDKGVFILIIWSSDTDLGQSHFCFVWSWSVAPQPRNQLDTVIKNIVSRSHFKDTESIFWEVGPEVCNFDCVILTFVWYVWKSDLCFMKCYVICINALICLCFCS